MSQGTVLSSVLAVAIVVASSVIITNLVSPLIDEGVSVNQLNKAKQLASVLDSVIKELSVEAAGAKRVVRVAADFGTFEVNGKEDRFKFRLASQQQIYEPGTIVREANYFIVAGPSMKAYESDVNNDGTTDLVLENDAVVFAVRKLGNSTGWVSINTTNIISMIRNKRSSVNITPLSGIFIGEAANTSYGVGFTELTRNGLLQESAIRVLVNSSSARYEALFTLRSAQDFVELEVKNIQNI
jgi:nucleoid DNA-binding protein